jgi:hypothetical protein
MRALLSGIGSARPCYGRRMSSTASFRKTESRTSSFTSYSRCS